MKIIICFVFTIVLLLGGCSKEVFNKAVSDGHSAIENKDYQAAIQYFKNAVEENKDDEEVNKLLEHVIAMDSAIIAKTQNNLEQTQTLLNAVITYEGGSETIKKHAQDEIEIVKKQIGYNKQFAHIQKLITEKQFQEAKLEIEKVINEVSDNEIFASLKEDMNQLMAEVQNKLDEIARKDQHMYASYFEKVNVIKDDFGICNQDNGPSDCPGLQYVELIDFDNNGTSELYVLYGKSYEEGYHEEVWGYKNGEIFLLNEKIFDNYGLISDSTRSISSVNEKIYLIGAGGYSAGTRGEDPNWAEDFYITEIFEINNNKLSSIGTLIKTWKQHIENLEEKTEYEYKTSESNSKAISEEEYKTFLTIYGYDSRKEIINSESGSKMLTIDVSDNIDIITKFISTLRKSVNSANTNDYLSTLNTNEQQNLMAFIDQFSYLEEGFDRDNYTDFQIMSFLSDARLDGKISKDDLPPSYITNDYIMDEDFGFYYGAASVEQVNTLTQRLFGVTVAQKNLVVEGSMEYDLVKFQNGKFYIINPDRGGSLETTSSQIDTLYDLGNGLFYTEFTIYATDLLEGENDFYKKPIDTWSTEEKNLFVNYPSKSGYAVVKQKEENGKNMWQLVKISIDSKILTDSEIDKYKNYLVTPK
ncbi:hypothetical protein ACFSCX_09720 [Bacillus salitolerans]|uniref:Uncharacterized protein n=1 Tax=Bacillus salitolerans TaxID=1437434 RepID=A0ABW4LNV0_9BACI